MKYDDRMNLDYPKRFEVMRGSKAEVDEAVQFLEDEIIDRYNTNRKTARKLLGEILGWSCVLDEICDNINYAIDSHYIMGLEPYKL